MLRNYSNEALLHISRKPNDSRYHKAEALQELWESKEYYEKTRMLQLQPQQLDGQQHQQDWRQNTWSGSQGRSSSTKKEGESPYIKGGATHTKQCWGEPRETRQRPRIPQKYCSGCSQASENLSFSPKIVCFNCKKPGHIRRDCQEKHSLRRVRSPNPHLPELKRQGSINGEPCSFHLDTGADITAIPPNFVKQTQYRGEVYNIQLGNLRHECMQMAEIMLEVEGKTRPWKVIVMEGTGREALLGVDHPVTRSLFGRGSFIVNGDDPIPEEGTDDRAGVLPFEKPTVEIVGIPSDNTIDVRAITRAMSQAQEAELAQHEAANAKDGAVSITLALPMSAATLKRRQWRSKFYHPSILTPDPCASPAGSDGIVGEVEMARSPSACPQEEEGTGDKGVVEREGEEDIADRVVEADCIVGLEGIEPEDEPLLPDLAQDREGVGELITQQKDDETLSDIRKRAKRGEQGFYFNGGVLMH